MYFLRQLLIILCVVILDVVTIVMDTPVVVVRTVNALDVVVAFA